MKHLTRHLSPFILLLSLAFFMCPPAGAVEITECSLSLLVENVTPYKEFGFGWALSSNDSLAANLLEVHTDPGWLFTMLDGMKCTKYTAIWGTYPPGVAPGEIVQFGLRFKGMVDRTKTRRAAWLRPPEKAINPEETLMPIILQDFGKDGFYIIDGWPGLVETVDPVIVYPKWTISPVIVPLDSLTPGNSLLEGLDWTVEPPLVLSPTSRDSIFIPALSTGAAAIVVAPMAWAAAPADTVTFAVNQCVYLTTHLFLDCLTPSVDQGDTLVFDLTADNRGFSPVECDVRGDLKLPGGGWYAGNPLFLREGIRLEGAHVTTVRDSIPVPASLFPGTYEVLARIGYNEIDEFFSADSMLVEITVP